MRKNIIALMLVLPILFVLVVYGAVNVSSLDVDISASGIEIMERYPNDTISIDLADYDDSYEITPVVTPNNATNSEFEYRYELISGSATQEDAANGEVVQVKRAEKKGESDKIIAKGVGTVRVVAVSKDGGYEDSITVIVGSSKPYAFDFSMYNDGNAKQNLLENSDDGYRATLSTGSYGFDVKLKPNTHISPEFRISDGFAVADPARGSVTLPFTGNVEFDVRIPNGVKGDLTRHVKLNVTNSSLTGDNFSVNGSTDNNPAVSFDRESRSAEFYIESVLTPQVNCYDDGVQIEAIEKVDGVQNGWRVVASVDDDVEIFDGDEFAFFVKVGSTERTVTVKAVEFDFTIRTDVPNFNIDNGTNILLGTQISFYANPIEVASGVTYKWDFINVEDMASLETTYNDDKSVCTLTAHERDKFIIVVEAWRNGEPIPNIDAKEVEVEVINNVVGATSVDTNVGLAKSLAVPGLKYDNGQKVDNLYPIPINAHSPFGALSDGIYDFDYTVSDASKARIATNEQGILVDETNSCIFLEILGKGSITVTAAWKGNADWRDDDPYELTIPLTVDSEAVEVTTSKQLFDETEAGNPIVLGNDIMLGAYDNGEALPLEQRLQMVKTMKSTYNTRFYEDTGRAADAYVNYVVEFKNDVYGNGHSVCGEYFAHAVDGNDVPQIFKGPLFLVAMGDLASVAAQDNIVFLCRTDGVTIHNATLLGCSDSSRTNPDTGKDDLTRLDYTGTVLEINADVNLLNCRVRNGRNVVRVYGGNRNGENYFVNALPQSTVTSQDRAVVRIEGCILSHSREFVLKLGANRALRSTSSEREPYFTDRSGNRYPSQADAHIDDNYFYQTYVLTDVTLADCVLEKSGLFCIGVESNFAGEMLCPNNRFASDEDYGQLLGGWSRVGGTSFAAMLRLKGNVRMYDWKNLDNVNSDTLIRSDGGLPIKLDIASMINYMSASRPDEVGPVVETDGNDKYVHGGIALYGGGRNYSQIDMSELSDDRKQGLRQFNINISELTDADGDMGGIGQYLPLAAGTQDFRFFMYDRDGSNNRAWQDQPDYNVAPLSFQ